jgi:hypothetical protein
MVEKDTVIKENVKFSGVGNFKEAYNHAHDLLSEDDYSITENTYSEKVSGNGKDIDIVWSCSKKLTDYFKSSIAVRWKIIGMSDVEGEIDGKKVRMNKFADFKIDIKGVLEKDYSGKWEGSAIHKFFKEIYHKYVIPGRTEEMEEKVENIVKGFKEEMKSFLELTAKR